MNFQHKTSGSSGIDAFAIPLDEAAPLLDFPRVASAFAREFRRCTGLALADQPHLFLQHSPIKISTKQATAPQMNTAFRSLLQALALPTTGVTLHSIRATRALDLRLDDIIDRASVAATASGIGWKSDAMAARYTQLAQGFVACRQITSRAAWHDFTVCFSRDYAAFLFFRTLPAEL